MLMAFFMSNFVNLGYITFKHINNITMKKNMQQAIIFILIGAFFIYWAIDHSPKAGLGKIVGNELGGSYTMSETWYYITLVIGAALAVLGVKKFLNK